MLELSSIECFFAGMVSVALFESFSKRMIVDVVAHWSKYMFYIIGFMFFTMIVRLITHWDGWNAQVFSTALIGLYFSRLVWLFIEGKKN